MSDVSRGTCLVFTCPRGGRTEQGYCSVSYVAYDSTSFRISNTIPSTSAAIAQIGENMYVLFCHGDDDHGIFRRLLHPGLGDHRRGRSHGRGGH